MCILLFYNMVSTVPEIMVNYKKIDKGFVGQCPDNLQFLVQTKSKPQIKVEIKEMIEDYVKIFPKERKERGILLFKLRTTACIRVK